MSQMWLRSSIVVAVCRPAAIALIPPLAWKLPYAVGGAQKKKKKKKKKKRVSPYERIL